jgi:hypothetical protein
LSGRLLVGFDSFEMVLAAFTVENEAAKSISAPVLIAP